MWEEGVQNGDANFWGHSEVPARGSKIHLPGSTEGSRLFEEIGDQEAGPGFCSTSISLI